MEHWEVEVVNSTYNEEAQAFNVGKGRLCEFNTLIFKGIDLASPSQTIYGGGGIQVAEVGAIYGNKIQ
jgi:hypothetical protein